jgi:HK97 family phage prohead protease
MQYAIKNCGLAIKDVDTERGTVSGYFSAFNNQDSDEDIIPPGAYAKTIQEVGPNSAHPRVKHLLDHDTRKGVAKILSLEEDSIGLRYDSKAGRHTNGRDFLLMCQDGIITEHSVGFDTVKSEPNSSSQSGQGRILKELKLWEGSSLQAWGANPNTPVLGAKSMTPAQRDTLLGEYMDRLLVLTKALKGAYSDDLCERLEIQVAQLDALCKSLIAAPLEEEKPLTESTLPIEPDFKAGDLIGSFTSKLSFLN